MVAVTIPNNWRPRGYQLPAWHALEAGIRRVYLVWHRRSGKDDLCLHWTATQAVQKPGTYWHMLPQANQARKAIWEAVNPHSGKRRIDEAFPMEIRSNTRDNEMSIRFRNGSMWQLVGSDNYNALVGSPPLGVVFSEYALADPDAWALGIRPILLENGGWAIFNTTPRGRNHAKRLLDAVRDDPEWYSEVLTVEDTHAMPIERIQNELRELTLERGEREAKSLIQQEYYCSFDAAIPGSIYGPEMKKAEEEGRVLDLPYDVRYPVTTAWDLGGSDPTAIVFGQANGEWIDIIDFVSAANQKFSYFAKALNNERDYAYRIHLFPHDGNQRHQSADLGTSYLTAKKAGINPIRIVPKSTVEQRIRATHALFPKFRFDRRRTSELRDALINYQFEWDSVLQKFKDAPKHDWTSHSADAMSYFAQGFKGGGYDGPPRREVADMEYDPFA
jgi:hypothetical protein